MDRNPLEIFLLGLCVLAGAGNGWALAHGLPPADHVPVPIAWAFAVLLVFGGAAGIAGSFWRDAISGILIVRAAMIPTCAGSLAYAVSLLTVGTTVPAVLSVAGFSAACGIRAWGISRRVRHRGRPGVVLRPPGGGRT